MNMQTVKTADLIGPALDWAVAQCEGYTFEDDASFAAYREEDGRFNYSTDWAQGGPIIDQQKITVGPYHNHDGTTTGVFQSYIGWANETFDSKFQCDGPTSLIAAMRCYVASKLGNSIAVPAELVTN